MYIIALIIREHEVWLVLKRLHSWVDTYGAYSVGT